MRLPNWAFLLIPATCLALVLLMPASEDLNPKRQELAMKVAAKKLVLGRDRGVFVADAKQARKTVRASQAPEAKRQESARKNNASLTESGEELDASNLRDLILPIHDAAKRSADLPIEPSADTALANTSTSSPNNGPAFSSGRRCAGLLISDFKWQPGPGMRCSRSDNAINSKPDSPSDAGVNLDAVGPKRTGELLRHDWSYCARRCPPFM